MAEREPLLKLVHPEYHMTGAGPGNSFNEARKGELIGLAYAAMYEKPVRGYATDAAGEAYGNPTYSSVMKLNKYLLELLDHPHL
jgi:hypothetical protein